MHRIITLLFVFNFAYGFAQCEKEIEREGITIYTCENSESDFRSVKAEFTVHTNLSNFVRLIWDVKNYDKWQYRTIMPRVLKVVDFQCVYYYVKINSPFPVSDRDLAIDMRVTQDSLTKNVTITMTSMPDYIEEFRGVTRVIKSKAEFIAKPIDDKSIQIFYHIAAEPGGYVSARLANLFAKDGPYFTFQKLKAMLDHQYSAKAFGRIKD
jgi:hypothetical protein